MLTREIQELSQKVTTSYMYIYIAILILRVFGLWVQRNLIHQENVELSRKVQRIHQENVELYKKVTNI